VFIVCAAVAVFLVRQRSRELDRQVTEKRRQVDEAWQELETERKREEWSGPERRRGRE